MVTQHGKNLVAGLSKTQHGRYPMSKMFNVKQEPISLQPPRKLQRQRQLQRSPQQLARLRLTPIHILNVKLEIHGYHVQIAIRILKQ